MDEVGMNADHYKRQVYELKDQMGIRFCCIAGKWIVYKTKFGTNFQKKDEEVHDLEASWNDTYGANVGEQACRQE